MDYHSLTIITGSARCDSPSFSWWLWQRQDILFLLCWPTRTSEMDTDGSFELFPFNFSFPLFVTCPLDIFINTCCCGLNSMFLYFLGLIRVHQYCLQNKCTRNIKLIPCIKCWFLQQVSPLFFSLSLFRWYDYLPCCDSLIFLDEVLLVCKLFARVYSFLLFQ